LVDLCLFEVYSVGHIANEYNLSLFAIEHGRLLPKTNQFFFLYHFFRVVSCSRLWILFYLIVQVFFLYNLKRRWEFPTSTLSQHFNKIKTFLSEFLFTDGLVVLHAYFVVVNSQISFKQEHSTI